MIKDVLKKLYKAPDKFRWALAVAPLIESAGLGMAPCFLGPRGRLVRVFVRLSQRVGCTRILLATVAIYEICRIMAKRRQPTRRLPERCRIFVGVGAGGEENLWGDFIAESEAPAIRLDETKPEVFLAYYRPRITTLWREVWEETRDLTTFLLRSDLEPLLSFREDLITVVTIRLGRYIFYRTWWRAHVDLRIQSIIFVSSETPASACVDAAIAPVEHWQHGLTVKGALMPPFTKIKALTSVELDWFSGLLPKTHFELVHSKVSIECYEELLIIVSSYDHSMLNRVDYLNSIKSLVDWANSNSIRVVVRKHPVEVSDFWESNFPSLEIDITNDSFSEALSRLRPMFIASWYSTCFVDGLTAKVLPISFMDPEKADTAVHLVYNILRHCLIWPKHQSLLSELINSSPARIGLAERLMKSEMDSPWEVSES